MPIPNRRGDLVERDERAQVEQPRERVAVTYSGVERCPNDLLTYEYGDGWS